MYKYLLFDIASYLLEKKKKNIEFCTIAFLANSITDDVVQNIKLFIPVCKSFTIVTKEQEKLKKMKDEFYEKEGIMLLNGNNKNKTLLKKDLIVNFDFSEDEINKYNLNDEAIIINLRGYIRIYKKRFCGLNINDYDLNISYFKEIMKKYLDKDNIICNSFEKLNQENIFENKFDIKEVYEAIIYRKDNFNNIRNLIKNDNIKIENVIGINGKIF